jgi:hypothetical protein
MARFARDPTPQERAAASAAGPASPEMTLLRLRQYLDRTRLDLEQTSRQFRLLVQKGGQAEIEAVLGADSADLTGIYASLTALIVALDDTAQVPTIDQE